MPVRIETIDSIARQLGRDVIFLDIQNGEERPVANLPEIAQVTTWLEVEGIG